ncbi:MAG: S8 family peptidase [Actinomycetota bacterium]
MKPNTRTTRAETAIVLCSLVLSMLLLPTASHAAISEIGGQAVLVDPAPASVRVGVLESDSEIRVFHEQQDLRLATPVTVDAATPGTYTWTTTEPGSIPAGTRIDSHFLHADHIGSEEGGIRFQGSVSFSSDILGVILTSDNLAASDATLGAPGTLYPTAGGRGLEGGDHVTIQGDQRTIVIDVGVFNVADQVRAVTAAAGLDDILREDITDEGGDTGDRPPAGEDPDIEPIREGFETESPVLEAPSTGDLVPNEYIVEFKPGTPGGRDLSAKLARDNNGELLYVYEHALQGFAVRISEKKLAGIQRNPNVRRVEQDSVVGIAAADEEVPWGLRRANKRYLPLPPDYAPDETGAGVNVYVVDTGIRGSHLAFEVRAPESLGDCNGHGTHVAGTVGAATTGIARQTRLIDRKALDCSGAGTISKVIQELDWVHASGPKPGVVVMSFEGSASPALDDAVNKVIDAGFTVVAAAGNKKADACNYSPARVKRAITVGATTSIDEVADYSNQGSCVDLFAPGSTITSTWNTSDTATHEISGTSTAAAHVGGVAALYLDQHPKAAPAEVKDAIVGGATKDLLIKRKDGSPNLLLYGNTVKDPISPPPVPLANPGFEEGWNQGWTEFSTGRWRLVKHLPDISRTGEFSAWLGGYNGAVDRIQQRITSVPAGARLTFWWQMRTNETTTTTEHDTFEVRIYDGETGQNLATRGRRSNLSVRRTWSPISVDLSEYAGRSITIRFVVRTDDALATSFYVDDVVVDVP